MTAGGSLTHIGNSKAIALFWSHASMYRQINVAGGALSTDAMGFTWGNGTGAVNCSGSINVDAGTLTTGGGMGLSGQVGNTAYLNFAGGTFALNATAATPLLPATGTGFTASLNSIFGPIDNSAHPGAPVLCRRSDHRYRRFRHDDLQRTTPGRHGRRGDAKPTDVQQQRHGLRRAAHGPVQRADVINRRSGSSGYALVSGGQVTGIVITCPGVYSASDTVSVTFNGGGGTGAAIQNFNPSVANSNGSTGGLTKISAGNLIMTAVSTYTGPTTINGGMLQIGNGSTGALSPNGTISIGSAGTLAFNRNNSAIQGTDFSAAHHRVGNLTQLGVLTTLNAANSYTGVTTISAGTPSTSTLANGLTASNIGAASNAASNLVFTAGSTFQYTGSTVTIDRGFTINNGVTATFDVPLATTNLTLAGMTAVGGTTGAITKINAGTLTLSGVNTYSGLTTATSGILAITGTNAANGPYTVGGAGTLTIKSSGTVTCSTPTLGNGSITNLSGESFC